MNRNALCLLCVASAVLLAGCVPTRKAGPVDDDGTSLRVALQREFADDTRQDVSYAYAAAFEDLDDDGRAEAIVRMTGQNACGSGGCSMFVFAHRNGSWRQVSHITITQLPVRMLEHKSSGWHDLAVRVQGGGIQPGHEVVLTFDGEVYPLNPSVAPARAANDTDVGRVVIAADAKSVPLYDP